MRFVMANHFPVPSLSRIEVSCKSALGNEYP